MKTNDDYVEEFEKLALMNKLGAIPPQWKDWLRNTLEAKDKEADERVREEMGRIMKLIRDQEQAVLPDSYSESEDTISRSDLLGKI